MDIPAISPARVGFCQARLEVRISVAPVGKNMLVT